MWLIGRFWTSLFPPLSLPSIALLLKTIIDTLTMLLKYYNPKTPTAAILHNKTNNNSNNLACLLVVSPLSSLLVSICLYLPHSPLSLTIIPLHQTNCTTNHHHQQQQRYLTYLLVSAYWRTCTLILVIKLALSSCHLDKRNWSFNNSKISSLFGKVR